MRKFDGVIFDMDGLMVDTENMMQKEVKKILQKMGYDAKEEITLQLIGLGDTRTKDVLENAYGKQFDHNLFLKMVLEVKEDIFHNQEIGVKKGLWELLKFLKRENIKNIVATGSTRESMNLILQRTGILKYFELSVCGDEIEKGKPFPDIFIKAAEKLNLPLERCLILEDSQNGIIAAKRANMSVIFVKDLVAPEKQYMEQIYAECSNLAEVIDYLK